MSSREIGNNSGTNNEESIVNELERGIRSSFSALLDELSEFEVRVDLSSQPNMSSESNIEEPAITQRIVDNVVRFTTRRRPNHSRHYRQRSVVNDSSGDEHPNGRSLSIPEAEFSSDEDSSSSSSSSPDARYSFGILETKCLPTPKVLLKTQPKHNWFSVKEIITREIGWSKQLPGSERFQHHFYGSLHAVQRLELMYKLQKHKSCVNALHFNQSGELLASGSDDKQVVLWNWAAGKHILHYDSGHSSSVFQAKFLPLSGDRHIVTCARDGQVRMGVLSSVGMCKDTVLLARHTCVAHKLAIHPDTPHVFLSAGEDALVLSHDVRVGKPNRIGYVKDKYKRIGLYSIENNPLCSNEFVVGGEDVYVRIYDRRKAMRPLLKYCPNSMRDKYSLRYITCAVYNYNGTEVLASYNDDNIYLFDTKSPEGSDYVHMYEGHRNSNTLKSVNFFGPKSEYVVSGSDCGYIYFWDKSKEAIVQWMRGDEEGVVNSLEPHPRVPIIATSGLDDDIKIWVPSCDAEPSLKDLKDIVANNQLSNETRANADSQFNNHSLYLWRQIEMFGNPNSIPSSSLTNVSESLGDGESNLEAQSTSHSRMLVDGESSSEDDDSSGMVQCTSS